MEVEKKYTSLQYVTYSLMLRAGAWKQWLPEWQYKYMIAAALNECLYDIALGPQRFLITGYLISGRRIYIICKIRFIDIEDVLESFEQKVKKNLVHERNRRRQLERRMETEAGSNDIEIHQKELFELFPINNFRLARLIKGERVEQGYYDPELERLKKIVQRSQFCSAIDYSGGEGPVIVFKEHHKE